MFTGLGTPLAFLPFGGGVSTSEMVILGAVAVLLFGSKLPDVMRSMGKSLSEFRKGMAGIENELRAVTSFDINSPPPRKSTPTYRDEEDRNDPAIPKFDPPPASSETQSEALATAGTSDASSGDRSSSDASFGAESGVPRYEPPKYEPPAGETSIG